MGSRLEANSKAVRKRIENRETAPLRIALAYPNVHIY